MRDDAEKPQDDDDDLRSDNPPETLPLTNHDGISNYNFHSRLVEQHVGPSLMLDTTIEKDEFFEDEDFEAEPIYHHTLEHFYPSMSLKLLRRSLDGTDVPIEQSVSLTE